MVLPWTRKVPTKFEGTVSRMMPSPSVILPGAVFWDELGVVVGRVAGDYEVIAGVGIRTLRRADADAAGAIGRPMRVVMDDIVQYLHIVGI